MKSLLIRPRPTLAPSFSRYFCCSSRLADSVRVVEVGARDGLQNEKTVISLETKIDLIRRLAMTGLRNIEAGSFVPAKQVPQMASTSEVFQSIAAQTPRSTGPVAYNYLVPNLRGMETLVRLIDTPKIASPSGQAQPAPGPANHQSSETSGASTEISLMTAATETFSNKNLKCSIEQSLDRCKPILAIAKDRGIRARGYISVALGCPYEGPDVDPHQVAQLTAALLEMGCDQVSVADTTGMGTVPRTHELLKTLRDAGIADEDLALHFHDTYGQALLNTVVALDRGIRTFDSSVAGLGGCPFAPGATGNVSTEDLLHLLHSLGLHTGVDMNMTAEIGAWISAELGRKNESRAGKAVLAAQNS